MKFFSRNHRKESAVLEEEARMQERMEKLYTVEPAPEDMPARFAERLAAHESQAPAVAERPRASALPSRKLAFAGVGGVMAVAAGLAVAAMLVLPGSGSRSGGVAEALQFLQEIPATPEFEPGTVIHTRTKHWRLYGEGAGETRISESWGEIGPDSTLVRSYSRTLSEAGTVLHEALLAPPEEGEPGAWRSIDAQSGQARVELPYQPVPLNHSGRTVADIVQAALEDGRGHVVSQTDDELIVEIWEPIPEEVFTAMEARPEGESGPPSYWDLKPRIMVNEVTFRADGVLWGEEMSLITETGERVIHQWWRTSVKEVLDHIPDDLP